MHSPPVEAAYIQEATKGFEKQELKAKVVSLGHMN